MAKRHVKFNLPALKHIAGCALRSPCVEVVKLLEGLYNKVLSLRMENGKEVLARIPNPNAGQPHYVVASEVATLDFVCGLMGSFDFCLTCTNSSSAMFYNFLCLE